MAKKLLLPYAKLIRDLWQYRELLIFLFWKEVNIRYKQAFLGIAWSIITPSVQALVFFFVFTQVFKVRSAEIPYLLLVFSGLIFWNFLSGAVSSAASSLTGNPSLISKAAFPREILVGAAVLGRIPDLLGSLLVLIFLTLFYGFALSLSFLWLVPIFVLEVFLAFGIGLIFAAINVYFRDINALLPLLLTVWLFLTPVVYQLDTLPPKIQFYAKFNPMAGVLESIRYILFLHKPPDLFALSLSVITTIIVLSGGFFLFKKLAVGFADMI